MAVSVGTICNLRPSLAWRLWALLTAAKFDTAQGDALCKGCGRTEDEVQHWPLLSPAEKRLVWRRITQQGTAWRFNRYAERARLSSGVDHAPLPGPEQGR